MDPVPRATRLIAGARRRMLERQMELANGDPSLRWARNRPDLWQFCLLAASIGLATVREKKVPGMVEAIDLALLETDPSLRDAVKDFLGFIFQRDQRIPTEELPRQIGLWVLWNVKGTSQPPLSSEAMAAAQVGDSCLSMAATWDIER